MQTLMTTTAPQFEKMDTATVALAFTKREENSAIESTVAWTMATLDVCLGWTKPKAQGMDRKTAVKIMRKKYAFQRDTVTGEILLDDKGNERKRSAIYSRLAVVDKVIGYMIKALPGDVTDLHNAALSGDSDRMESLVCTIAAALAMVAGDDTLDALVYFLDHGKAKKDEPKVENPVQELTDQADKPKEDAPKAQDSALDKVTRALHDNAADLTMTDLQTLAALVAKYAAALVQPEEMDKAA